MFTVHFSEDLCRSRFSIFITLTMKILPQPQPRSVLIVQRPVSTIKSIFEAETFHFNVIVFMGRPEVSFGLHALQMCKDFQKGRPTP